MSGEWMDLQTVNTENRQQNWGYIQSMMPELQARLSGAPQETLRVQSVDGVILCRVEQGEWILGGRDAREEVIAIQEAVVRVPDATSLLILLGTGNGYALAAALSGLQQNPGRRLLVLEKSSTRILACLTFLALKSILALGRLHFEVTDFSLASVMKQIRYFHLEASSAHILWSPEIPPQFTLEEFHAALGNEQEQSRQRQAAAIQIYAERKAQETANVVRRALLLDCWQDAPGQVHLRAIQKALEARGVRTHTLPLHRYRMDTHLREYRRLVQPTLQTILEKFQPDIALSYGYHAPHFFENIDWLENGLIALQTVSNIGYYDTVYYPQEHTALIEKNLIPYFIRRGSPHPFFVPLMADYVAPQPVRTDRRFPIVFVGNSLIRPPEAAAPMFERFTNRPGLLRYIHQAENDLRHFDPALNLYSYLDTHPIPEVESETDEYEVFRYLLCQGSAARRVELLESIADLQPVIFGGDWNVALRENSPLRACVKGYLSIHEEIKIFSMGHLFVNIQSIGHVTGPNMRFFNVAGSGSFQISDGEFSHYLQEDKETVYYRSAPEFREKVLYYLNHVTEADEIRRQALERVKKDWTYRNWVDEICQELKLQLPQ